MGLCAAIYESRVGVGHGAVLDYFQDFRKVFITERCVMTLVFSFKPESFCLLL